MRRTTFKSIIEKPQNTNSNYKPLPKFNDIVLNLSVSKDKPEVIKTIRLIGNPFEFRQYGNKQYTGEGNKTEVVEFPDAHKNKNPTRIGLPDIGVGKKDPDCPWNQLKYSSSRRCAQTCLEQQEDGTWVPKILSKGFSIFGEFSKWEQGRVLEDDTDISTHLGGLSAPTIKIQAKWDTSKLGYVDYKVFVSSKDMKLTEDHINLLREIREPSADEMNALRAEYLEDRKEQPELPEWHDFFEYGFDLRRIFKFTPLRDDSTENAVLGADAVVSDTTTEDETLDDENLDDLLKSW